jgi:hypothetical protein
MRLYFQGMWKPTVLRTVKLQFLNTTTTTTATATTTTTAAATSTSTNTITMTHPAWIFQTVVIP